MFPLSLAKQNQTVVIEKITGSEETRKHLQNLGFSIGTSVFIVTNNKGNIICRIKDSRLAISLEMSMKIFIK